MLPWRSCTRAAQPCCRAGGPCCWGSYNPPAPRLSLRMLYWSLQSSTGAQCASPGAHAGRKLKGVMKRAPTAPSSALHARKMSQAVCSHSSSAQAQRPWRWQRPRRCFLPPRCIASPETSTSSEPMSHQRQMEKDGWQQAVRWVPRRRSAARRRILPSSCLPLPACKVTIALCNTCAAAP